MTAGRRRRPAAPGGVAAWMPLFAIGAALVGVGLVAWSMGWFGGEADVGGRPPGTVAVPVAGRDVPAHQALELEDLLEPATGELAVVYLPADSVLDETVTDARRLIGRVLGRDKRAGRVFREPDFLPEGTRPGLVAGIPAGKVALRIEAHKVTGSVGLRRGDRFDLVATWRRSASGVERPYAGSAPGGERASVEVVATDAAVVDPLSERQLPASTAGRPGAIVEEMVIAVRSEEVPRVTEALELASRVDCVPRSGRPGTRTDLGEQDRVSRSAAYVERDRLGRDRSTVVETIQGGARRLLEVPRAIAVPDRPMPSVAGAPPGASGG
ncbi:MAG: hypothetical protein ACQGVC_22275 [Myxococcota bacterium]